MKINRGIIKYLPLLVLAAFTMAQMSGCSQGLLTMVNLSESCTIRVSLGGPQNLSVFLDPEDCYTVYLAYGTYEYVANALGSECFCDGEETARGAVYLGRRNPKDTLYLDCNEP